MTRIHRIVVGVAVATAVAALAPTAGSAVGVGRSTTGESGTTHAAWSSWRPKPTPRPSASLARNPTPTPSPTAGPTSQPNPPGATCASGAAPVSYQGTSYCPGYIFGVRRTLYGVSTRIVLRGVVVELVSGTRVRVSGGPSCLPTEWCGQTIPSLTVTFPARSAVPAYGDMLSLYGITTTGGLTPVGFQVTGHCDPYWGDC